MQWVTSFYGFHDVILLNGTYYAFAESNCSETMIVRSTEGTDVWEAFVNVGGTAGDGPLELPTGASTGWTPSGSFVDLGHDRGYGKVYVDPRDSDFYLAVNSAAVASLPPADLEAAFINPANWTWHDDTTGPAANPILSGTAEHDLRECWVVPNSNPDDPWTIVYDADFGVADGGKALGWAELYTALPTTVYVDDDYDASSCAVAGHTWQVDCFDVIGDGVNGVAANGTVYVAAGLYDSTAETFPLIIDKSVDLLGAQANVDPRPTAGGRTGDETILDADETSAAVMQIASASNVEINGFTITGGTGDMVEEDGHANGLLFSYNVLYDDLGSAGDEGIQIKDSDGVIVEYNYFYDILQDAINVSDSTNSTVRYNEMHDIYSENAAIYCYGATNTDIVENLVYNVPNNDGIKLGDSGDGSSGGQISGNVVHDTGQDGITSYASGITIEDNTIYNAGSENGAMYLYEAHNSSVTGNTIYDNAAIGLLIDNTDNAAVEENEITGNDGTGSVKYTGSAGIWLTDSATNITIHENTISGNAVFGLNNEAAAVVDATDNWWGCPCGPSGEGPGSGDAVSTNVAYSPWYTDAGMTASATEGAGGELVIPVDATLPEIQAVLDCASGRTVLFENGAYPGGIIVNTPNTTINLNGSTFGPGSPAFTINAANVTILGPGTLNGDPSATGTNSSDPAVLVNAGADNFTLKDVEVLNWEDGVQIAGDVTSLKVIGNYIHDNTDAGLQVDASVVIDGIVTVEGNLFKANGTGIRNDGANSLPAQYNSWGALSGPGVGDTAGATAVDTTDYTFAEVFMDVEPDTEAIQRDVVETETFEVGLKVDAENLLGLVFHVTYDTSMLTLNSTTWATEFAGNCQLVSDPPAAGSLNYRCTLMTEYDADGGTVATFEFTAEDNGGLTGDGSWTTYYDIIEGDTSTGAVGGVKIYVNNAGYGAPSVAERDITDTNDGQIDIVGIAQYTGFVDLQGRANDSGATVGVYDEAPKSTATLLAEGTSASGGAYTTVLVGSDLLTVGTTYWLMVDAEYYLPTTASVVSDYVHSALLDPRPVTELGAVKLLGGDATDDDEIDITDLSLIGGVFGTASSGPADVNGDGQVDILDLVLAGGNYALDSSPWTL